MLSSVIKRLFPGKVAGYMSFMCTLNAYKTF